VRGPRLLLVLLLLTAFTLTVLDVRFGERSPFDALRGGAARVLGPVERLAGGVASDVGDVFSGDSAEQERLSAENARLKAELRRSEDLERRVADLDALLGLREAADYPRVPARVVAAGSSFGFSSTLTLDAGSRDGIREGQSVVSGDGLVGRTLRVGPTTCTVLLVTDPGFTVGARLTRQGTVGLATGTGRGLRYELVEGGRVEVDDALLTTGSDTFVPGIPLGRVVSVEAGTTSLVTTAVVEPFARLSSLDLVAVVVAPPRSTPRVPLQPAPPSVPPAS